MEIKRTANAGVLLTLDGVRILLDGVCGEVPPYLPTSDAERRALLRCPPHVVAVTHQHADHYDAAFVSQYRKKTAGPVLGPADIPGCIQQPLTVGGVKIIPVPSRHLGKSDGAAHISYIIEGSRCIWFMGDASPMQWSAYSRLPRPELLIAPYAYATAGGWELTKQLAPKAVILLHLPQRERDNLGLWPQVEETVGQGGTPAVYIPKMGQRIQFLAVDK